MKPARIGLLGPLGGLALGLVSTGPLLAPAAAFPQQQFCSISLSRQFAVYCSDNQMRYSIASAVEEIKTGVLAVLGQKDLWKAPIVINVRREDPTEPNAPISRLQMVEVDQGFKIELQIRIGQDPAEVHFQEQVVKAILLEFAYRNRPVVKGGTEYLEPPEWLVHGIIQVLLKRASGSDLSDIFKSVVDTNRLMPLSKFLAQRSASMDSASMALYQAYSLCLVTLLRQSNNGPYHLSEFLRNVPSSNGDPVADLAKAFPDLGKSQQTLEKWWSLSVARLAAENRFRGLTLEETEQRLNDTLKLRYAEAAGGAVKTVELGDFKTWLKQKPAQAALAGLNVKLIELSVNAHPLLRDTIGEYQAIVMELAHGKTRGVPEHLAKLKERRAIVLKRMNDIEDLINWFEATQMSVKSNAFDEFLKKSRQWEKQTPRRTDAISQCLDQVEAELK